MKKAFKLVIAKKDLDGCEVEHYLTESAAKARLESLKSKGFSVTMSKVVSFKNNYVEVI